MKKYNLINNVLGWVCFAISAVTYLLTIEPTASFWDCPEFISQGAKLEVGHPPGNPIFMLAARFFVTIFGGSITNAAVAVNSMSALLSAATILLLFWTITHLVKKIMVSDDAVEISPRRIAIIMGAGLCGALMYTWSDTFWYSAVEGEVYAFSSFCTALVFWLILKWENRADEPHSDRYLVLIAYVIGVSIAVHLLNLLCIPAIVLVFYYRKYRDISAKGSLIALGISFVLVAAILYGLVPGFIKVSQWFELLFVNAFGLGYNSGVLVYAIVLVGVFIAAVAAIYQGRKPALIRVLVLAVAMLSGLTFISSSKVVWLVLTLALAGYLFLYCRELPMRVLNVAVLSVFVIFVGYSSYALLLIRASANTPMNQNAPDNVFALSSYLNREQYGQTPLFYGPTWAETYDIAYDDQTPYIAVNSQGLPKVHTISTAEAIYRDANYAPIDKNAGKVGYTKVAKSSPDQPDKYVAEVSVPNYQYSPGLNIPFTRIYSMDPAHVQGYKTWSGYTNPDVENIRLCVPLSTRQQWAEVGYAPAYQLMAYMRNVKDIPVVEGDSRYDMAVWKPTFMDNIRYFLNYQLNHMYWRYFMWNFAGRQNDIQGNGEPNLGNWLSGWPVIDNSRLGDQSYLPYEYGKGNKGHNVFYMLPLLMGLFGIIWQALCTHRRNPERGIEQFWVVFFLFFMTGIAIVLYLNQTPGQPRERDYAFAGSFYAFAIWVGMGVPAVQRAIASLLKLFLGKKGEEKPSKEVSWTAAAVACAVGILVPLQVVSQTWDDHDRSHRYTTRDFGANYLNSLGENAIIFTNGDNDTFPLWYTQEVEGERTDVRVVNLSYLATEWYANQMIHPTYDAAAVKFLAKPTDYAYDRLAYSAADSRSQQGRLPALEGLQQFYAAAANDDPVLRTPLMYSPVDKEVVIERFGINPNSADSTQVIPYIKDVTMNGLNGSGFSLSKLLSFDAIANTIADGFERPIYFATTVPGSYYLGLQPFMYSTGMAQQVTPFDRAPASPLAEKAYENIVSKYRWGGLDDPKHGPGLYLDETVRRLVSTTRNSMIDVAAELTKRGSEPASAFAVEWAKANGLAVPQTKYDMARYLLNLMEEKLPEAVTPYESMTDLTTAEAYLKLFAATHNTDDLARAETILDTALPRYAQIMRYANALGGSGQLGGSDRYSLQYVPIIMGYKQYADLMRKLAAVNPTPEMMADVELAAEALGINNALYVYNFVYLENAEQEQLEQLARAYEGHDIGDLAAQAAALTRLHKALGIDAAESGAAMVAPYGLTIDNIARYNPNPLYSDEDLDY